MAVNLGRLFFSLAVDWKPIDCLFRGRPARALGPILTLRQTMPLLRTQHAFDLLALLEFFQNEVHARLRAVHSRIGFSLSHAPIRHRTSSRARRTKSDLPTVCNATPLDLVCRACYCTLNFTLARAFIAFFQRICIEHDPPAIARRVCRTLRPSVHRMHICNAADRKRHTFHRGRIVDAVEKENGK